MFGDTGWRVSTQETTASELHAWGDSNLYLRRRGEVVWLTVEHRAAPGRPRLPVALVERGGGLSMAVLEASAAPAERDTLSPRERVLQALTLEPMSVRDLRERCRMRTATLCELLTELVHEGAAARTEEGWRRVA